MIYSVCAVQVPPGKVPDGLARLSASLDGGATGGTLRACLYSEIGALNRILMISEYASAQRLLDDHSAVLTSGDPLGIGELATALSLDAFMPFPGTGFLGAGKAGPIFEVRSYELKRPGVAATFAAWERALGARIEVSPLAIVMYAVSGTLPRFMHIWPYASLDQRMALRAEAVHKGIWPPPGGLPHIETMKSEIYLAAPFSPLQ